MDSNPQPVDQSIRDRFVSEIDTSFALNCSAGSGKTRAISDRGVSIAQAPDAEKRLASLVVVTFTEKAAEEIQVRARERLLAAGVSAKIHQAFSRAFFGTIHSFAVSLLQSHGHLIGVPASFEVVDEADRLWLDYLRSPDWCSHAAKSQLYAKVLRHLPMKTVLDMASKWDATRPAPIVDLSAPTLDFSALYAFPLPKRADTAANISSFQDEVREFEKAWTATGQAYSELPVAEKGGKEFMALAKQTLHPAAEWLGQAATVLAEEIFTAFREWRVRQGILTYDDQIALAVRLLQHADGRAAVRSRELTVILDEAQDTDPEQFDLLLNCTLPVQQKGGWRDGVTPAPGRFCMVGDMQQSIYGQRADLATYRRVHSYLTQPGVGESLVFSVTFRCDQAIVDFCNQVCPASLDGEHGQVSYVPLAARPAVGLGQVVRLPFAPQDAARAVVEEADAIAQFLSQHKPGGLRAANWGQIAILVPRTAWFGPLRQALLLRGIRSVQLSQAERNQDSPSYAWLTALCTILTDPRDSFQIVGVLRDIYGISDRDLALYCKGRGAVWQIAEPTEGDGAIASALQELHAVFTAINSLPLRVSIAEIDRCILRPRLRALPASDYGDLEAELDPLVALASAKEGEGSDLRGFTEYLRDHLTDKPAAAAAAPDCVNLLTCYKSKGLEWDCVVVPYLGRQISAAPNSYPCLVGDRFTPARFAFDKADTEAAEPHSARTALQELRRLLYVTLTRARQTLVLVDDRGPETPDYSMANGLLATADLAPLLEGLPAQPVLDTRVTRKTTALTDLAVVDLTKALELANQHRLKVSPHALSDEDWTAPAARTDGARLRSQHATIPLLYGIWWHDTFKLMPWNLGVEAMKIHFRAALESCPDQKRAETEWSKFLGTDLLSIIVNDGRIWLAEAPFLTQAAAGHAIEGVIDLAVHIPGKGWLIFDWKTGLDDNEEHLLVRYGKQVEVYRDSVAAFTGEPASGYLYSTTSGVAIAA